MKFKVIFSQVNKRDKCPMINIETEGNGGKGDFGYSNIYGMYNTKSTQGVGIQVNNSKLEKPLLKMCDKIAQAVYDYQEKIKEGL